jgi:hypothetical protein
LGLLSRLRHAGGAALDAASLDPRNAANAVDEFHVMAQASGSACALSYAHRVRSTHQRLTGDLDRAGALLEAAFAASTCPACRAENVRVRSNVLRSQGIAADDPDLAFAALRDAVLSARLFRALAAKHTRYGDVLRCCEGSALNAAGQAAFFWTEKARPPIFHRAVELTLRDPEVPHRWWGRTAHNLCVGLPVELNRKGLHDVVLVNFCVSLAHTTVVRDLDRASELLPRTLSSLDPVKDVLSVARLTWLDGRLLASAHAGTKGYENRRGIRRRAESRLRRAFSILVRHGSPVDAVMVLSDLAALPWSRDPASDVRCLLDLQEPDLRPALESALSKLDPVLSSKVSALSAAAESRDHAATLRRLDDLRASLADAGTLPPMCTWRLAHRRAA